MNVLVSPCLTQNPCKNGGRCLPIQDLKWGYRCLCQNMHQFAGQNCSIGKIEPYNIGLTKMSSTV